MPKSKLTPAVSKTYQKLLNSIAHVYDTAMKDVAGAVESIFKKAYWEIGRIIVEDEQKGEAHAVYGERLLEQISKDMSASNRKGFSVTNLRNMRRVYEAFPIQQLTAELTWTHFVALSSIKDKKERQVYTKKALEKKWTVDELEQVLFKDQVKTILLEDHSSKPHTEKSKDIVIPRLAVKRGVIQAVEIVSKDISKKTELLIDLGFRCYRRLPEELKLKKGDIVRLKENTGGKPAYEFLPKTLSQPKSVLYTFESWLEKTIDGDTIQARMRLEFGLSKGQKLRLRKIDAPEIDTKAGLIAKNFVDTTLKACECFVIKTYSTDIYDRYLADVFYLPGCSDPHKIAAEGIYLNQELIDKGLAEPYQTPDPRELAFLN